MLKKYPVKIILCLTFVALFTTGCITQRKEKRSREEKVLAKVGNAELRESDVKGIYSDALTGDDSVKLLESYVNSWVRKQVKLREAEKVVESSGVDIEAMVNEYRNMLLTHRLDQYYVEQHLDTLITYDEVNAYYRNHRSEFALDRNIVKGRIVRIPASYRQQDRLKELMISTNAARQQDFRDLCAKNNFQLTEFDSWMDFKDFLAYLPVTRGENYDAMMTRRNIQEMSDANYKYLIHITENMPRGETAPLEWVGHIVRRIILNQRSAEIVRRNEDSLVNAALEGKKAIVNIESRQTEVPAETVGNSESE